MSDKLLKTAGRSGVYHLPQGRRKTLEEAAGRLHLGCLTADLAACRTTAAALRELGSALHFPVWYGANFDALHDCLTDSDWQPGKGLVLMIDSIESLRRANPEDFATLIEVFKSAAETRRASGSPCWILLDSPARGVDVLPEA